jgi:hypothetical protein
MLSDSQFLLVLNKTSENDDNNKTQVFNLVSTTRF